MLKEFFKSNKITMNAVLIAIVTLIVILVTHKYQLISNESNVYRINQITGNVKLIQGTRLVSVDNTKSYNKIETVYTTETISKDINCELDLVWRNNKLYYNVRVFPFNFTLKKAFENEGRIEIKIEDIDTFVIASIPIYLENMTRITGDNNAVSGLSIKGNIPLDYEDMKAINLWEVEWSF